ncbi:exodeoxyribonuclease VII small subunit [bacterium]|nr:exodeoxyribonuclease VII small subunit [bacterium]
MDEKPIETLTYEEGLKELEEIIQELESNNGTLEEMIHLFERGQAISKHCLEILDKAELRVQTLASPEVADDMVL